MKERFSSTEHVGNAMADIMKATISLTAASLSADRLPLEKQTRVDAALVAIAAVVEALVGDAK